MVAHCLTLTTVQARFRYRPTQDFLQPLLGFPETKRKQSSNCPNLSLFREYSSTSKSIYEFFTIKMLLRNSLTKSHALKRLARATSKINSSSNKIRMMSTPTNTFPTPVLFDYETIKNNLTVADAISSVEEAFGALADGKVDVPMPMHIGIEESEAAGPGDCHIKVSRIRRRRKS